MHQSYLFCDFNVVVTQNKRQLRLTYFLCSICAPKKNWNKFFGGASLELDALQYMIYSVALLLLTSISGHLKHVFSRIEATFIRTRHALIIVNAAVATLISRVSRICRVALIKLRSYAVYGNRKSHQYFHSLKIGQNGMLAYISSTNGITTH